MKGTERMDAEELCSKYGVDADAIERSAEAYERGDWDGGGAPVRTGSHLNAVGTRRVTVVYNSADTQMVEEIARAEGCKPSDVYRAALADYLAARA